MNDFKVGDLVEAKLVDKWFEGRIVRRQSAQCFVVDLDDGRSGLAYGDPAHIPNAGGFLRHPLERDVDPVEMPSHYTQLPVECIDVTEHFSFCLGNAIKYIWRADHKGNPIQDLEKARWYIQRELDRRKREA